MARRQNLRWEKVSCRRPCKRGAHFWYNDLFVLVLGAFNELSLNQNLYLGGVPTFRLVSPRIPVKKAFKGCVQKVNHPNEPHNSSLDYHWMPFQLTVNEAPLRLVHSAIDGADVGSCPHLCSPPPGHPTPCGALGECRPKGDDYSCQCPLGLAGVNCEKRLQIENGVSHVIPSFGGDGYLYFKNQELAKKWESKVMLHDSILKVLLPQLAFLELQLLWR